MQEMRPHEKQRKKLTPPSCISVSAGGGGCWHCLSLSSDDAFSLSVVGMLGLLALSVMGIVGVIGIVGIIGIVGVMGVICHWSQLGTIVTFTRLALAPTFPCLSSGSEQQRQVL
jgi:hypothetical protein